MIIVNGYIKFKEVVEGGGIDYTTGYIADSTIELSEPIPCQFRTNELDYQGINEGNKFTIASYNILIEKLENEKQSIVQLFTSDDELLGEFPIMKIVRLKEVRLVRILV